MDQQERKCKQKNNSFWCFVFVATTTTHILMMKCHWERKGRGATTTKEMGSARMVVLQTMKRQRVLRTLRIRPRIGYKTKESSRTLILRRLAPVSIKISIQVMEPRILKTLRYDDLNQRPAAVGTAKFTMEGGAFTLFMITSVHPTCMESLVQVYTCSNVGCARVQRSVQHIYIYTEDI